MGFQRGWSTTISNLRESLSMHKMKIYDYKGSPWQIPLVEEKDWASQYPLKKIDIVRVQIHDIMSLIIFKGKLKNRRVSCIKDHSRRTKSFSKSSFNIIYYFRPLVFFFKEMQQFLNHYRIIRSPPPCQKPRLTWNNQILQEWLDPIDQDFYNYLINGITKANRPKLSNCCCSTKFRDQANIGLVNAFRMVHWLNIMEQNYCTEFPTIDQYFWKKKGCKPSGPGALNDLKELIALTTSVKLTRRSRVECVENSIKCVGARGHCFEQAIRSDEYRSWKKFRIWFSRFWLPST